MCIAVLYDLATPVLRPPLTVLSLPLNFDPTRQSIHLRHYTESQGCVEPALPSTPHIDECYANFRRLGASDQMFCDDPYFGGKLYAPS